MEIMQISQKRHWYISPWGWPFLIIGVLLGGLLVLIGSRTAYYYWQIKTRGLEAMSLDFSQKLTLGGPISSAVALPLVADTVSSDDPSFGNPRAKLTIVEFADFQCPYSKESSRVVRELALKYKDKINLIFRDFPLDTINKYARSSAEAAECAAEQGKFWPFHDKLFAMSPALDADSLKTAAIQAGLDEKIFSTCLGRPDIKKEVQVDYEDGLGAGIRGTPTFFINGVKVEGAIPKNIFEQIIQRELINR